MPGSNKRQRNGRITIRFTDAELAAVESAAERAGLSVAAYIRQLVVGAVPPRQSRRPPIERARLAEILGHVGKLGSNVNQLAKYGNLGRLVDDASLKEAAADIAAIRQAIMEALGRDPLGQKRPGGPPHGD
jgi:hypothetical protein